ncbi:lipopolysaccharide biosynthesis protein [Chloroflexota bacterium]
MNIPLLLGRLFSLAKESFLDGVKVLSSKEGLKAVYRTSLYRNAIYLMLNSAAMALLGFVFWILAARFYPAEAVGMASAVIAVAGFLATLSHFGLDLGIIGFLPKSGKKSNAIINSCFTVGGIAAIVVSLLFLAGLNIWSPALVSLRQTPLNIASFVLLVVTWTLYLLVHGVFVARQRSGFTLLQGIIQGLIRVVLVASLAGYSYAFSIYTSWGIGFAATVVVGLIFLLPQLQSGYHPMHGINKGIIKEMAQFSSANYVAGLVTKVPTFILPLMIINLLGTDQNAYFYIAYAVVGNALLLIPAGVALSLFAEGSHVEEALGGYVKRSLKFSFLLLVPLIILIYFIGGKILLLFGEGYSQEATRLLWALALSSLPVTVNSVYFGMKRIEKKMKSVIFLSALVVVIILGLSYFLLPVTGIMGVGIAYIAGHGAVTLVIIGSLLKKKGVNRA